MLAQVLLQDGVAVDDHGAELPAAELAATEAYAAVPVEQRPGIRQLEDDDQRQDQRRQQQQAQDRQRDIQPPLGHATHRSGPFFARPMQSRKRGVGREGGATVRHEISLCTYRSHINNQPHDN